jgi:medium-chain acyl-[acyl-carrier-protein] hydrolase
MTLDRWVPFRNESARVCFRLFAFPHAAGNSALYRPLRHYMPPEFDFCPVELPGRAARLDELPIISMSALMEELRYVLPPLMSVPFAFFGHSVGAYAAYEAARQLRSLDGRTAVQLFVSGRRSPGLGDPRPARLRSDRQLLAILDMYGGTPAAITQRPELMAVLLPILRADLALADSYAVNAGDAITCPITAFGGVDDTACSSSLWSWREFTRGQFRACIFPGGHFYFSTTPDALVKEIVQDLRAAM